MGKYSIKELERLSGIKAHTLRIWEKRYHLFEPDRTETNIRFYSDEDLKRLLNISILSNSGIKISKIISMDHSEIKEIIEKIEDSEIQKQKRVDSFIVALVDYDELEFNRLYKEYVSEIGVEATFTEVFYPFLEKIGLLWLTDEVEPSQEHFISHLIRQKLCTAIDDLPPVSLDANKVILFLPEGEYHELGLLFFSYLYKKRGIKVYYFGQSTPIEQVISSSALLKPNWVLTYAVVQPKKGIQKLISDLSRCTADEVYFIENGLQGEMDLIYPKKVRALKHFLDIL